MKLVFYFLLLAGIITISTAVGVDLATEYSHLSELSRLETADRAAMEKTMDQLEIDSNR